MKPAVTNRVIMRRIGLLCALVAPPVLLVGCGGGAGVRDELPPSVVGAHVQVAPASAGAIYRDGAGMSLFQDDKARNPGDLLTIVLSERTNARSSANTSTSKESDASLSVPLLAGAAPSLGGRNPFDSALSGERGFSGSGDSSQSNQLSGSLTATVIERLANGNLVVRGEKRLRLNQGDETVRVEGIVRPSDISTANTVDSSRIAEARIVYAGRGSLAEANAQGWLSRFFNSRWMPF